MAASVAASIAPTTAISIAARQQAGPQRVEIVARQAVEALHIAARRPAIGMVGEGGLAEGPGDHRVWIIGVALQPGGDLAAHAVDRLLLEPRLAERDAQQLEGLVAVAGERLHMAGDRVPVAAESRPNCQILDGEVEGARVIGTGALVEQSGEQSCEAGLAGRVRRRRRAWRIRARRAERRSSRRARLRSRRA